MRKGTVKWFNNTMKYGFVLTEEGREVFVHFTEIETGGYKTLKHGESVEFEVEETEKGPRALHLKRLGKPSSQEKNQESGPHRAEGGKGA